MFSTIVSYLDLSNSHMLDLSLISGFKKLHLYKNRIKYEWCIGRQDSLINPYINLEQCCFLCWGDWLRAYALGFWRTLACGFRIFPIFLLSYVSWDFCLLFKFMFWGHFNEVRPYILSNKKTLLNFSFNQTDSMVLREGAGRMSSNNNNNITIEQWQS